MKIHINSLGSQSSTFLKENMKKIVTKFSVRQFIVTIQVESKSGLI